MANGRRRGKVTRKRSLFRELMTGVRDMHEHRESRLTLRTHRVEPIVVPPVDPDFVRETREALHIVPAGFRSQDRGESENTRALGTGPRQAQ